MQAIYFTSSPEETIELGQRLGGFLKGGDVVLLYGDLGTGKTHFSKGIAKGLGITETIKSPTFVYVNEYPLSANPLNHKSQITNQKLFHYDLYRLNPGDDLSSIGLEETLESARAINVIEWADRVIDLPQKHVYVELSIEDESHKIAIRFIDPEIVPKKAVGSFYEEWGTPLHVRAHIAKVTEVALKLADAYIAKGEIVNLNLLYSGAMLHDLCRLCDFNTLNRDDFSEDITDEKWEKWEDLRKTHQGFHHADIALKFFTELGYPKTAELIYTHKSRVIVQEPERIDTLEKKILYYADKRVKHDEIVSLDERFRDGKERHGRLNDEKTRTLFDQVEEKTYALQKELFSAITLHPEDIA